MGLLWVTIVANEANSGKPKLGVDMPSKGQLKYKNGVHSYDIGLKGKYYVYLDNCPLCGIEKWREARYVGSLCGKCACTQKRKLFRGANNGRWTGGRSYYNGYVVVTIDPDSPFAVMAPKNNTSRTVSCRIFEHRLVMAQHLGRPLENWEVVHHKNSIRTDNNIENLELLPNRAVNNAFTKTNEQIQSLAGQVNELTKLVRLLLWTIQNSQYGNPELSGENESPKCVETIDFASLKVDDEIVQASWKHGEHLITWPQFSAPLLLREPPWQII